jgi:NADP-dependent 3-hydroxy acid dehydrogenase YdfG
MAKVSELTTEEMISPKDILDTVRWLISLSPSAVVKELVIGCASEV